MIKKDLLGDTRKQQLIASANDCLYRFVLGEAKIRGVLLNGTKMVHEMRANHELGILETYALGHAYLGAALMAASLKGSDRLKIETDCSGPMRGFVVDANAFGEVRGYLKQVPIPISGPLTDFNLSPFMGAGFLTVTKFLEDAKNPFSGQVALQYGNIANDLAYYYLTSEQIPTAVSLSVHFDTTGAVAGAGGLLLQALPGAEWEMVAELERCVERLPSLGVDFSQGKGVETLIETAFDVFSPKLLSHQRIEFMCHCSHDRMRDYLYMMPLEDLDDMRCNGPFPLRLTCYHCNTPYDFSKDDLSGLYQMRVTEDTQA